MLQSRAEGIVVAWGSLTVYPNHIAKVLTPCQALAGTRNGEEN